MSRHPEGCLLVGAAAGGVAGVAGGGAAACGSKTRRSRGFKVHLFKFLLVACGKVDRAGSGHAATAAAAVTATGATATAAATGAQG